MFMQNGHPSFGRLPTDRPHQFKAQFVYQLPFGTSIVINQFAPSSWVMTSGLMSGRSR
jgi:hypothetical protein